MRHTLAASTVPAGFTFDFEKHEYRLNGEVLPSVTQLLQEFALYDLSRVPPDRLEYKRILGTAVHLACHYLDDNRLDESTMHPDIVPYVNAYKKFREITGFEPRYNEERMYSKKWRFAGTLDRQGLFEWGGQEIESIIDIKCVWEMYPSTGPQTEGYKILFEENFKTKIRGRFGLQLKPSGHYEVIPFMDKTDNTTFLSCLHLHYWRKKHNQKGEVKNVEFDDA